MIVASGGRKPPGCRATTDTLGASMHADSEIRGAFPKPARLRRPLAKTLMRRACAPRSDFSAFSLTGSGTCRCGIAAGDLAVVCIQSFRIPLRFDDEIDETTPEGHHAHNLLGDLAGGIPGDDDALAAFPNSNNFEN